MHALVERDFYSSFLSEGKWLGSFSGEQCKFAVLGQPGIGKSSFGLWLLAQLLRSKRTVVFSRNVSSKPGTSLTVTHFVFHSGVAFQTSSESYGALNELLAQPAVVHISDSLPPRQDDCCHKVLITSPDPAVWRLFVEKAYACLAFFPLYSFAEMEALRVAEFQDKLSTETLALEGARLGPGSSRSVLPQPGIDGPRLAAGHEQQESGGHPEGNE
jgi:hypothetical protein